jgi:UDP-2-acetamido-2,6-beta-L-arabino-hexul-4-ose reductase
VKLAITGADGFLGWHVRVLLRALGWPEPVSITRTDLADPVTVAAKVRGTDRVLHLAGVNRGAPCEVAAGNIEAAAALVRGLRQCAEPPSTIVFANSVHAGNGTPYGDSKAGAADILGRESQGSKLVNVRLPNLYGEHGRPFYNSVVATYCHVLAGNGEPDVHTDRELMLVHAGDAAARLVGAPPTGCWDVSMPALHTDVRSLAERLSTYAAHYRAGAFPHLLDRHDVRLFNTYRSHSFPVGWPMPLTRHADGRGALFEAVKSHGIAGQTFCSTSRANVTRGEHFHLAKIERFVVLRGTAQIALRRVGYRDVTRFAVGGEEPVVVDMPTMWTHNITNTGSEDLLTLFWTNEVFDPQRPDTYAEPVDEAALVTAA